MDESVRQLRRSVQRLARRLRAERLDAPLTDVQRQLLAFVVDHGAQRPADLAERARTSPQAITRPLAALVDAGLMERRPDPRDGRQQILTISRDGWHALARDAEPRDRWLAGRLAELTEAERGLLALAAGLMDRLAADAGTAR